MINLVIAMATLSLLAVVPAAADTVTFRNPGATSVELHVRNGPVSQHPDNRGSKNTTMKPNDVWANDVGDGDTWFAYGNQIVNSNDNPQLCNAKGGSEVVLNRKHPCYANN